MADKEIASLPVSTGVTDDTLIPVYQPGAIDPAQKMTGAQFRAFGQEAVRDQVEAAANSALVAEQYAASIDPNALQAMVAQKGDNLMYDPATEMLHLVSNGVPIGDGVKIVVTGGGGGGGGTNNAVLTLTNTTGWIYKTIPLGSACPITFTWSSLEDGMQTGGGALRILVNETVKSSAHVAQGSVSVDLGPMLAAGSSVVKVTVSDVYGNTRTIIFNISAVALTLSSSFDDAAAYTGDIAYTYTPTGSAVKTVVFLLDGKQIGSASVATSGRQQSFTIPAQAHGSHSFEVYFTATIDGEAVESNHLIYALICVEEGNTTPIIATTFSQDTVTQYDTVSIPYIVYVPNSLTADVVWRAGDEERSLTVDRTRQVFSWIPTATGLTTLSLTCGGATWAALVTVKESEIDVEAEANDLELHLTSYGRSNGEANPSVWTSGDVAASMTGFNFVSDGWQLDEDGITALRVSGDARVTIPLKIFASSFRSTGKTIEFEFATRDVRDYDAVVCSCWSGGRGIQITTQAAQMASEQSVISTQYKENEHIRLTFAVQQESDQRLIQIYLNGILSGVVQYPSGDDFAQLSPVEISIGSNDATIDVYNIRVYKSCLTRYQILDNWIADTQLGTEKLNRWKRNRIYDDYGQIVVSQLPTDLPYLVVSASALPQFKGDKKTCSGTYVDPLEPGRSFTFAGAQIDVQGTSSQYYWVKNYKIKFKGGFVVDGVSQATYQLNDDVIPTDTFTFKADVASSEGANNVVLAQLYDDLCPVKTPPQEEDERVRQTIDGHPIVVFWDDGASDTLQFLGKYNFNHDKGTAEVFGFGDGDESWEILQNGTDRVGFKSADFSGTDWKNDFEARYPEDNADTTNLAEFVAWVASTHQAAATGGALAEAVTYDGVEYTADTAAYRLAKFKAELPDHASVDALVFYYVFTELFLCIDQREKNAFPTVFQDAGKWLMFFYDADSSLGIDNKGKLAFDYYLEDIDYTEAGEPIFNGQNSVLWVNLRQAFAAEIETEYKRLRTQLRGDGSGNTLISYDVVDAAFDAHQSRWPEAIFNEDGYRKSIEPLIEANDTLYLPMLQGKKELQRKWWLYNRFRYLDSKYKTGSSETYKASIRTRTKGSVWLTSFVNMYGHVSYNNATVSHRMTRGVPCEFIWDASGAEDPVVGISNMDLITSLGDLSPLMAERVDIALAERLEELKVGDAAEDYTNGSLSDVQFGNNRLLRRVDLRNCTNYTQTPDLSNCPNIEEVYLDGTAVKGCSLPNGGYLKTLHLPGTVTNLTIRNHGGITDFVLSSYSQITTLHLENVPDIIPARAILDGMAANTIVRLIGFVWGFDTAEDILALYDKLDTMRGVDANGSELEHAEISGTVWVEELTERQLAEMQERYPTVTVRYTTLNKYTVRFWNGDVLMQTVTNVDYGASATYTGGTPIYMGVADPENYRFVGWDKPLYGITRNLDMYAVFRDTRFKALELLDGTISGHYENALVTKVRSNAFYSKSITSISLPNVESIEDSAFYDCNALINVNFPNAMRVGNNAFAACRSITTVTLPKAEVVGVGAFAQCTKLETVILPSLKTVVQLFRECSGLKTVDFTAVESIASGALAQTGTIESVIIRGTDRVVNFNPNALHTESVAAGTVHIYVHASVLGQYRTSVPAAYVPLLRAIEDYPEITGG